MSLADERFTDTMRHVRTGRTSSPRSIPASLPLDVVTAGATARVRVYQTVRDKAGALTHEGTVVHLFTLDGDLVSALRIEPHHE